MSKIADVRLFWTPSPSLDIASVKVVKTINGEESTAEVSPATESILIEVPAGSNVTFRIDSIDSEGFVAMSETYTFGLGDLEAPFPATNLGHEVVGVRDVVVPPVA